MTQASIIEAGIDDSFWPKMILAMIYIKNLRPTKALQGLSPHQELFKTPPNLAHLRILGSTVYVLVHEERELKSEKFVPPALKGKLVGFNGHTIYRVHIEEQNRVISVKDIQILRIYRIKRIPRSHPTRMSQRSKVSSQKTMMTMIKKKKAHHQLSPKPHLQIKKVYHHQLHLQQQRHAQDA